MTRSSKWVLAVALLLFALLIAFLASHIRRVTRQVDIDYSGEAATNPYFACERMLRELGLDAESEPRLVDMPPDNGVLFLGASGIQETEHAAHRIVEWVERGGSLVLMLPSYGAMRADIERQVRRGKLKFPLASELGVALLAEPEPPKSDGKTDEDEDATAERLANWFGAVNADSGDVVECKLGGDDLEVELASKLWLSEGANDVKFEAYDDDDELRMLSFPRGAGWVTCVAADAWITNHHIDEHDHAQFAWELANLAGPRCGAWFVLGADAPGLLTLLARNAWMVLVSLGVLIVAWLWKSGARFGPLLPERSRDRRDFSEHVAASGEFLWRHAVAQPLLAAPRAELRRRIQLFRPDLAELEPAALERELAQIATLGLDAVHEALTLENTRHAQQFTRVVRNLATLRQNL
jgi:hypothetical protein